MRKFIGSLTLLLGATSMAFGHFPFIITDKDGATAQVILSDDLKPDPKVDIEKLANTKLTLRDSAGERYPTGVEKR